MTKQRLNFGDRIVADPSIMVGKPVVKGTRIPVELVLEDLFAAHPALTIDDVKACLAYAKHLVSEKQELAHTAT